MEGNLLLQLARRGGLRLGPEWLSRPASKGATRCQAATRGRPARRRRGRPTAIAAASAALLLARPGAPRGTRWRGDAWLGMVRGAGASGRRCRVQHGQVGRKNKNEGQQRRISPELESKGMETMNEYTDS